MIFLLHADKRQAYSIGTSEQPQSYDLLPFQLNPPHTPIKIQLMSFTIPPLLKYVAGCTFTMSRDFADFISLFGICDIQGKFQLAGTVISHVLLQE